jgi:hypothetical protein
MTAGQNGHDQTLRAMGAALGAAAMAASEGRESAAEEAESALRGMTNFTPRHFRVLSALLNVRYEPKFAGEPPSANFHASRIAPGLCMSSESVAHICTNLANAGLVSAITERFGGETAFVPTIIGEAIALAAASL